MSHDSAAHRIPLAGLTVRSINLCSLAIAFACFAYMSESPSVVHIGLLLAAGAGTRFGGTYAGAKLDQLIEGVSVGARSFENLANVCDAMVVVVRDDASLLARYARTRGALVIVNDAPQRGLGRSMALGAQAVLAQHGNALFMWAALADMPWIEKCTFERLRDISRGDTEASQRMIVQPIDVGRRREPNDRAAEKPGHPVLFGRAHWSALTLLDGDSGARSLIASHRDCVVCVETEDSGVWRDVDTAADLRRSD
jgi:molybdenum cofactor cytidylyltransferase